MIPLVYHSRCNITAFDQERLHPFDSCKYCLDACVRVFRRSLLGWFNRLP